jgi:pimeloyl-[acyl-carrier protein] methyl ester esterase
MYLIPGWGFRASVFHEWMLTPLAIEALDYPQILCHDLDTLTHYFAAKITTPSPLIGWSFGGLIATHIAYLYPEKVQQLILIASLPRFLADTNWPGILPNVAEQCLRLAERHPTKLQQHFIDWVISPHKNADLKTHLLIHHHITPAELSCLKLLFTVDLREIYQQLTCPILQIFNEEDSIVSPRKTMPNAQTQIIHIPNTNHAGCFTHWKDYQFEILKHTLMQI